VPHPRGVFVFAARVGFKPPLQQQEKSLRCIENEALTQRPERRVDAVNFACVAEVYEPIHHLGVVPILRNNSTTAWPCLTLNLRLKEAGKCGA
jgi:hypothetical protein